MANPASLKPFQKGDPRINRKGRPKSFDALRELAQMIAHERAGVISRDGHELTVAEAILRQWAQSKNPQLQRAFIEIAFGKVPDRTELTGADGGAFETRTTIEVKAVDYRTVAAALAPGSIPDSDAPGQDESPSDGAALG